MVWGGRAGLRAAPTVGAVVRGGRCDGGIERQRCGDAAMVVESNGGSWLSKRGGTGGGVWRQCGGKKKMGLREEMERRLAVGARLAFLHLQSVKMQIYITT